MFKDEKYLNLALAAGNTVWERGLIRKGYSICHGVSGNAYCFLELYQLTQVGNLQYLWLPTFLECEFGSYSLSFYNIFQDQKQLYRAMKFAEWCLDYTPRHEEHFPDRPLSLYEGIAGPMYLLLDIQKPLEAKFPGFTL